MSLENETKKLKELRENILKQSNDTRETLELLQQLFSHAGANKMHNVSIMYNNKINEIVNLYHKHDMEFFDFENHFLNAIIFNYLVDSYIKCVNILDDIIKYLRDKKIFTPSNNMHVISLINKYIEISDNIFNFDIYNDVGKSFYYYCVSKAEYGYMINLNAAMNNMSNDLKELDINPEPIKESYFSPKDIKKNFIKKLCLKPKKRY